MAVRSTNADRRGTSGGSKGNYRDHDPNKPTYGGVPKGRQEYYGDGNQRYEHTPGSSRGQKGAFQDSTYRKGLTSPRWDDRNKADDATADQLAADMLLSKARADKKRDLLSGDAAFMAAKGSGDLKGQIAAMLALRQKMQEGRFIDQGGTAETWANRFAPDANWPVPKSPLGVSSHGPGRPDFPGGGSTGADMDTGFNRTSSRSGGAGGIQGYQGPTEDMPPGMTLDIPSNNILSALRPLNSGAAAPAKKPTVVRRGGGRVTG